MRKIKFIKVVVPEIVGYMGPRPGIENMEPDYRCHCGMGVAEEYVHCPYCAAQLDWANVKKPSQGFMDLMMHTINKGRQINFMAQGSERNL